ncbi:MAG: peptidoglycan-associated lipoprotein Pal [Longimicrobiales bacterium]|nr:peptidoglycan-associated lipoprotein Pal [Longimicrobiales bacterium]
MTHRRLMLPVTAALMILAAACSSDPPPAPPVEPTGPTPEEIAEQQRVADSIARAQAEREAAAREAAAREAAERERQRQIAAARETLAEMVFFDYDEAEITAQAQGVLQRKVDILRGSPAVRIQIAGHADERGSNEYNIALGNRRAQAVRDFLTGFGIAAGRMSIVSYGEDRPLVNQSNEEAWARNRRAEFTITAGANQINPGS